MLLTGLRAPEAVGGQRQLSCSKSRRGDATLGCLQPQPCWCRTAIAPRLHFYQHEAESWSSCFEHVLSKQVIKMCAFQKWLNNQQRLAAGSETGRTAHGLTPLDAAWAARATFICDSFFWAVVPSFFGKEPRECWRVLSYGPLLDKCGC